jgi:hypothetical protein
LSGEGGGPAKWGKQEQACAACATQRRHCEPTPGTGEGWLLMCGEYDRTDDDGMAQTRGVGGRTGPATFSARLRGTVSWKPQPPHGCTCGRWGHAPHRKQTPGQGQYQLHEALTPAPECECGGCGVCGSSPHPRCPSYSNAPVGAALPTSYLREVAELVAIFAAGASSAVPMGASRPLMHHAAAPAAATTAATTRCAPNGAAGGGGGGGARRTRPQREGGMHHRSRRKSHPPGVRRTAR